MKPNALLVPTVEQSNNRAGRDIVGGNQINNQFGTPAPSAYLARLLEKYQQEVESNAQTKEKLLELQRFGEAKENPLIPLEKKLADGGRSDLVEFALEEKEGFAKKLARFTHFPSAQMIHLHLLANIYSVFSTRILPAIREGQNRDAVECLIQHAIIEPTLSELRENPFNYSAVDVQGMLYYLTGNCYIKWA